MKKQLALTAAICVAAISSPSLAADLLGSTATATLFFPDLSTTYAGPVSAMVGPGVEFGPGSFAPAVGTFDIGANTITFFSNQSGSYGTGSFNGYRIDFTGKPISLSNLTVTGPFTPMSSYLSGNSLFFNVSGQDPQGGSTTFNVDVTAVPEASTWAMMIGGLGVVGVAMRRRRRATTAVAVA